MNDTSIPRPPRVLLVEDDPVSASFLRDAASALPAQVDVAASIADALIMARHHPHDLYLIDANLPDGRGETLLQSLRDIGLATPALAHTAARDNGLGERMRALGFVGVLYKPLGVAELHHALRQHLPGIGPPAPSGGKLPNWDDAGALAALGGQQLHVDALRGLFLQELPGQRDRIVAAAQAGDVAGVRGELHRLVASCGFVGAARLAQAVHVLQQAPLEREAGQQLQFAIVDLLASA